MAFNPISPRAAGHGVRCTLLTLRLSAWAPIPSTRAHSYVERQFARAAVRWIDTHCYLNAIAHCWSRRHVHA